MFTYPSGKQSSTGYFINGKPIGIWTNFYESGQINSQGKWSANGLDSVWLFYTSAGQIERSISYANNLKNGRYIVYDSLQQIKFDGFYVNDTLQGPYKRFEFGKLVEEGNYNKGQRDGLIREFDGQTGRLIKMVELKNGTETEEKWINRLVNGKKEGLWQTYDANGKLISQEIYKNGELVKDDSNPNVFFTFEKEFHPNGVLKAQYAIQNGMKNGIQSNFDEQGQQLVSEVYKNDTLVSSGWFTKEGSKDSLWQTFYPNGNLLSKGNYVNGKKEGVWTYYFPNQKIEQKGRYKDDLPTSEWVWYYPNGQIRRIEHFFKGKYDGEILDYDSLGALIQKQTYAYNSIEGDYYYFVGDHQEKGKMQNGLREGKWVYYYNGNKKAFVGKYKDGLPDGKHKIWFENGKRAYVLSYKKGKLHGRKLEYYEKGGLMHDYLYKNGTLISMDGIFLNRPEEKIEL